MKISPSNIKLLHTADGNDDENAEIFDDFLSNIDEFQQKFDINTKEYVGRVKTQQRTEVADFKRVKKKTKGGLF